MFEGSVNIICKMDIKNGRNIFKKSNNLLLLHLKRNERKNERK